MQLVQAAHDVDAALLACPELLLRPGRRQRQRQRGEDARRQAPGHLHVGRLQHSAAGVAGAAVAGRPAVRTYEVLHAACIPRSGPAAAT